MYTPKREAEIKVRVKKNPRPLIRKAVLLGITLYIVYLSYGFIHDLIITNLAKVEQIQQGIIQTAFPAKGLLIRNETIVAATGTGKLKVLIPDGERVRVGQVVAQVVSASLDSKSGEKVYNITAPRAGIVSYHLDGLENVYSAKNVKELDLTKLEALKGEVRSYGSDSSIEQGKPVLKIINNLDPLLILANLGNGYKLSEKQDSLLISFDYDPKSVYRVSVVQNNFGKVNRQLLTLGNFSDELLTAREVSFKVVTNRFEGFIIPENALVQKDGIDGIYTVYKERVKWKKVEVRGKAEGKFVISNVTPDIKVILNPEYVKEGHPFKLPDPQ